jgi:hypothetical protein
MTAVARAVAAHLAQQQPHHATVKLSSAALDGISQGHVWRRCELWDEAVYLRFNFFFGGRLEQKLSCSCSRLNVASCVWCCCELLCRTSIALSEANYKTNIGRPSQTNHLRVTSRHL